MSAASEVMRWTGGASVPLHSAGMLNLPRPLAVLSVEPDSILLVLRPGLLASRAPGHPWSIGPADRTAVFPVRATGFKRGVGFAPAAGRPFYFWCGRLQDEVLAAIRAAGFPVEAAERRPQYR